MDFVIYWDIFNSAFSSLSKCHNTDSVSSSFPLLPSFLLSSTYLPPSSPIAPPLAHSFLLPTFFLSPLSSSSPLFSSTHLISSPLSLHLFPQLLISLPHLIFHPIGCSLIVMPSPPLHLPLASVTFTLPTSLLLSSPSLSLVAFLSV